MEQSVTLRAARPEDQGFLLEVYASTRAEELALTSWTPQQKEDFVGMQFIAQKQYYEANYPGAEFLVILLRGQPAGRLYIHRSEEEIRIMDIALLPVFRRQGIGTWLLKKMQAEAGAAGKKLGIHVEIFNPAMRLYENLGFAKAEDRGVYSYLVWARG